MYPHRIRLHGPWEVEPVAWMVRQGDGTVQTLADPVPPATRMTMPCRWHEGSLGDFTGRVRFRRRFGYPGRIDAYERVWLSFDDVAGSCAISLNGQTLGCRGEGDGPFEFEITALLKERNELVLLLDAPDGQGGLSGEVALEIRCTAFLRAVHTRERVEGDISMLEVNGEVVGNSERPLELYVLVDGATEHYAAVAASAAGTPFHVKIHATVANKPHIVRVDLVQGALLWYVVERAIALEREPSV
jgi:hypothetical protein